MNDPVSEFMQFARTEDTLVLVTIDAVRGSTPREEGAWMLVGQAGIFQTIGGGHLELHAIDEARKLLMSGKCDSGMITVTLGPETGQCCGGTVTLSLRVVDSIQIQKLAEDLAREASNYPTVYVFGAGHVGKALTRALALLPVQIVVVDTREKELAGVSNRAEKRLVAMPEEIVRSAVPNSVFVVLTHDHGLDFLITREALLREDAAYVGLIGSASKRASFRNWLRREGAPDDTIGRLVCPIGGEGLGDKRPEVIAAHVASEISRALFSSTNTDHELEPGVEPEGVAS